MLITDQMQRVVNCPDFPQRIISLVPSQTELLFYLGLGDSVVGITKFCIHPAEQVRNCTIIGGTKNFKFEVIASLKPDLIIGNKEENYEEGIEKLALHYPVLMTDIVTFSDALQMIELVGEATRTSLKANLLVQEISTSFEHLVKPQRSRRTLYFIWKNPYMAAGRSTFIDKIMSFAGFENVLPEDSRYPALSPEEIQLLEPEVILLSSEPYPFTVEKHLAEFQLIVPNAKISVIDGEMFSWYGSRLRFVAEYLHQLQLQLFHNEDIIDKSYKEINTK